MLLNSLKISFIFIFSLLLVGCQMGQKKVSNEKISQENLSNDCEMKKYTHIFADGANLSWNYYSCFIDNKVFVPKFVLKLDGSFWQENPGNEQFAQISAKNYQSLQAGLDDFFDPSKCIAKNIENNLILAEKTDQGCQRKNGAIVQFLSSGQLLFIFPELEHSTVDSNSFIFQEKIFPGKFSSQKKELCMAGGGNFLPNSNECENVSQQFCEQELEGKFNQCASACRNKPNAKICTRQCIFVCQKL